MHVSQSQTAEHQYHAGRSGCVLPSPETVWTLQHTENILLTHNYDDDVNHDDTDDINNNIDNNNDDDDDDDEDDDEEDEKEDDDDVDDLQGWGPIWG